MSSDFEWKRTDECLPPRGARVIANLHMVGRYCKPDDFSFFAKHMGGGTFVPIARLSFFEKQALQEALHANVSHWALMPELPESERSRLLEEDKEWR